MLSFDMDTSFDPFLDEEVVWRQLFGGCEPGSDALESRKRLHGLGKRAFYRIALPFMSANRSVLTLRATVLMLNCKLSCVLLTLFLACAALAQNAAFVMERDGRLISLEPYGANIIRMTMS